MVVKIETGSEGAVSALSLEPGDWYSLFWLWLGDTFLGVVGVVLWEPACFFWKPLDTAGSSSPLL